MTGRPSRRHRLALLVLGLAAGLLPAVVASPGRAAVEPRVVFTELPGFSLVKGERTRVAPAHYAAYRVDLGQAGDVLAKAPARSAVARGADPLTFSVPDPGGRLVRFRVQEDSVMEPGLQARHPEIHTYAGRGIDDPTRTIRLDVTPMGFHASVRSPGGERAWYVDPAYNRRGATTHLSYYGSSVPRPQGVFVERDPQDTARVLATVPRTAPGALVQQRTYRLAFVTDPTYADYFGTANVAAEKVTLVSRVDHVYNDDLAVRLLLVNGTDKLNLDTQAEATGANGPCGAHGCYLPDEISECTGATLTRNDFVLGQIVGADSFDIGHLGLGVDGGGVAGLGVVGGAAKARGCTGLLNPEGDIYAIDFVAHELGHQFGGHHTFNGVNGNCVSGNRTGPTSVEPGSGSSVMAYAGICGRDDLQPHSDPYFSQRSVDEITAKVTGARDTVNERQVVNLKGFNVDGESFQLTYGTQSRPITRGSNYTKAGIATAVDQMTGFNPAVSGYDGANSPGNAGFTLDFRTSGSGTDIARFGVAGPSAGVTGFVGTIYQGGPGGNRGSAALTSNHAPEVNAPVDRTIPVRTPFTLTGSGNDPDGTALTYLWEQNDPGGSQGTALLSNTKANGPLFRVFGEAADVSFEDSLLSPSPGQNSADGSPSRTFPDLVQVLAGNTNAATGACPTAPATGVVPPAIVDCYSEFLPTAGYTAGPLDFRLTARDGFAGGGGASYDDVRLTLDTTAGPLLVTSQATAGTPTVAGGTETVTWVVNNTDRPALAPSVRIRLSADGGQTFPHVLTASTANDGTATVTLPAIATDHARIKVEAVDNYFFDINDADFTIQGAAETDPPETTITSGPAEGSFVLTRRTTVGYSSDEAGSLFECFLDAAVVSCGAGGITLRNLSTGTHVFTVAARDPAGNLDPTPARRVFGSPFAVGQLTRVTGGWQRLTSPAAYRGAYLRAASKGQVLTRTGSSVRRIALVVGTGPGFGRVEVFFRGVRIRTISLASSSTRARVLKPVATFAEARSGRVKIRTLSGRTVRIEGLGILSGP